MKSFRQLPLTEFCNADAVHCWSNLLLRTRSCMFPDCCLKSWLKAYHVEPHVAEMYEVLGQC